MAVRCMKPLTDEWVRKAEDDYTVSRREYRARKDPSFDAVCFHAQQCVEKYLKACLQEAGRPVEKPHNLVHLLDKLLDLEPLWESMRTSLVVLNNYAVAFRYPGEFADRETAKDAVKICSDVREQVRTFLDLE
jgi:HEPN domain-containing protein